MSDTLYINKCPPYIIMLRSKKFLTSVFLKSNRAGEISPARLLFLTKYKLILQIGQVMDGLRGNIYL